MRAFVEEAAGISSYKERRRETEHRISHTRENLERLSDLREEVDKQIRHLQRQAGIARRYQESMERKRQLQAESLALRIRDLDSDIEGRHKLANQRETEAQAAIAELRAGRSGGRARACAAHGMHRCAGRGSGPLLPGRRRRDCAPSRALQHARGAAPAPANRSRARQDRACRSRACWSAATSRKLGRADGVSSNRPSRS